MVQPRQSPARSMFGSLVLIAVVIGGGAAAFAYTAGWFSPQRLTPDKFVDALTPPTGEPLGHRRNHAKGICFTGHRPLELTIRPNDQLAANGYRRRAPGGDNRR